MSYIGQALGQGQAERHPLPQGPHRVSPQLHRGLRQGRENRGSDLPPRWLRKARPRPGPLRQETGAWRDHPPQEVQVSCHPNRRGQDRRRRPSIPLPKRRARSGFRTDQRAPAGSPFDHHRQGSLDPEAPGQAQGQEVSLESHQAHSERRTRRPPGCHGHRPPGQASSLSRGGSLIWLRLSAPSSPK